MGKEGCHGKEGDLPLPLSSRPPSPTAARQSCVLYFVAHFSQRLVPSCLDPYSVVQAVGAGNRPQFEVAVLFPVQMKLLLLVAGPP